jgi:predicted transposase YbfD/YdcC
MKSRIPMLWLAVLTIYQSYVTTDALSTLKSVEANQEYTLKYMEKSASILKKFKRVKIAGVADNPGSGS